MVRNDIVGASVGVLVFLVLLPASAWAQGETGTIAGVVKDTTGAVMPGVTVEASSPALIEKVPTCLAMARPPSRRTSAASWLARA